MFFWDMLIWLLWILRISIGIRTSIKFSYVNNRNPFFFQGASNVQSGMDRSPSSISITRNHSASVLPDLNGGEHPKVSKNIVKSFSKT